GDERRCLDGFYVPLLLKNENGMALGHCDASPAPATADRSAPVGPAFGHPAGHLSSDSPRLSARCGHALRSLRVPTRSITGGPTANASPSPTQSDSAASRRTPLSWPSGLCLASVPAPLPPLRSERNTNSCD